MQERDEINDQLDNLQIAINRKHEDVRLEAMWDPSNIDPEIHLSEEELDEFIKTFSEDERIKSLKELIKIGAQCEDTKIIEEKEVRCTRRAVASVDFHGVTFEDSVLVCGEDLRGVYGAIKSRDVKIGAVFPSLTINGKSVPRVEK